MDPFVAYIAYRYNLPPMAAEQKAEQLRLQAPNNPEIRAMMQDAARYFGGAPSEDPSGQPASASAWKPPKHVYGSTNDPFANNKQRPAAAQPSRQSTPMQPNRQPIPVQQAAQMAAAQQQAQAVQQLHSTLVSRGVDPSAAAEVATKLLAPAPQYGMARQYGVPVTTVDYSGAVSGRADAGGQ